MKIEFLPYNGNLQIKSSGHRHVLNDFVPDSGNGATAKSGTTNEIQLVKEVFNAVMAVPETRGATLYKKLEFDTGKGEKCPILKIDKTVISLLDDFSSHALEARAFINAIKNYDQTNDKGLFVELCELENLEDEPDSVETETKFMTVDKSRLENGKWIVDSAQEMVEVVKTVSYPKVDNLGKPLEGRHIQPKIKKGKKVSHADKDRLDALRIIRNTLFMIPVMI